MTPTLAISPDTMSEDAIYIIIGNTIQYLRKQVGMSQQRLAERLGLTRVSIVNIEAGRQRLPIHTLHAIAMIFEVPMHVMFQEVDLLQEDESMQLCAKIARLRLQLDQIRAILSTPDGSEPQS